MEVFDEILTRLSTKPEVETKEASMQTMKESSIAATNTADFKNASTEPDS